MTVIRISTELIQKPRVVCDIIISFIFGEKESSIVSGLDDMSVLFGFVDIFGIFHIFYLNWTLNSS